MDKRAHIDPKFLAAEWKNCAQCRVRFHRDKRNTWVHWGNAKFCSRLCSGQYGAKRWHEIRLPMAEDFARWFDKTDGCWEWKGAIDRNGYGAYGYKGKSMRAPPIALMLDGRPVPKGMYACHHCDNPRCVRPDHLYAGTPKDNVRDMLSRGRNPVGSKHYAARITEDDVVAIRASSLSPKELATVYPVCASNITMIRNRRTWKHVP